MGIIVAFFASRHDRGTAVDLVRRALEFFGTGVAAVECSTTVKEHQEVLATFGFIGMEKTDLSYMSDGPREVRVKPRGFFFRLASDQRRSGLGPNMAGRRPAVYLGEPVQLGEASPRRAARTPAPASGALPNTLGPHRRRVIQAERLGQP